jgi:hypothetical protein
MISLRTFLNIIESRGMFGYSLHMNNAVDGGHALNVSAFRRTCIAGQYIYGTFIFPVLSPLFDMGGHAPVQPRSCEILAALARVAAR